MANFQNWLVVPTKLGYIVILYFMVFGYFWPFRPITWIGRKLNKKNNQTAHWLIKFEFVPLFEVVSFLLEKDIEVSEWVLCGFSLSLITGQQSTVLMSLASGNCSEIPVLACMLFRQPKWMFKFQDPFWVKMQENRCWRKVSCSDWEEGNNFLLSRVSMQLEIR